MWCDPAPARTVFDVIADIATCKTVKDDAARLKCFDTAVTPAEGPAPESRPARISEWTKIPGKAKIDDSPEFMGMLSSESGDASLVLRCREHNIEAIFHPNGYLGSGKPIRVIARFNDAKAIETRWIASSSGQAAFAPAAPAFIAALQDDSKLFLRAYNYNGVPADALFQLGKVSEVAAAVTEACAKPQKASK